MLSTLPAQLKAKIVPGSLGDVMQGRLRNRLVRVATVDSGVAYLKVGTGDAGLDIRQEATRLRWIGERLPVPSVIFQDSEAKTDYLLISEVLGTPSSESVGTIGPQRVVEVLADGLRRIHALPIENCPFDSLLEDELAESGRRVRNGLLDESAFEDATGSRPSIVLSELLANRGEVRDLVFTHGDYSLSNVLLNGAVLGGVIDWGIAGIADRHRDFMCVEQSIKRNCGSDWMTTFYDAYGYSGVDHDRIRFYWLLDQFNAHYNRRLDASTPPD